MNDLIVSLVRTYVPIVVGTVVAWLTSKGLDVSPENTAGLVSFLTALIGSLYYLVARLLEKKFPQAGKLLGIAKELKYK